MIQLIRLLNSHLSKFIGDVVGTATSKERLKRLIAISLYRNAFYLAADYLALPATGFVFWMIAARFYHAEDVGLASATIAAMGLLAILSALGLNFGLIRFLPRSAKDANYMVNTSLTMAGLASIVSGGIFLAGLSSWSPTLIFLRQNAIYLAAFLVFTVCSTLATMVDSTCIAHRRAGFSLARGLIFGLSRLPLAVLLAAFFHSFGIFASWGVCQAVSIAISALFFLPRIQPGYRPFPTISKSILSEMAHFSFTNYLVNLFWSLPNFVLPIMVLNILGAELNAYFYIAWSIGNLLGVIPLSISMSLFAEGSYDEQRLYADTWRSLKLTFLIIIPSVILIVIIADKLLLLFGSSYSHSGTTLLRILTLSALPIAINYIYIGKKRVEKKMAVLIKLSVFIAIATLTLSYLLLPRMGIDGAGVAWLGSQGVVALWIVTSFLLRRPAVRERWRRFTACLRRAR